MTDVLSHKDHKGVARILNLPAPASADEPATKAYVDASYTGQAWKSACRVASTVSINIASPGSSIDGVTRSTGTEFWRRTRSTPPSGASTSSTGLRPR